MKPTDKAKMYLNWAFYYKNKADVLKDKIDVLRSRAEKITASYQDVPVFGSFEDHRQSTMAEMVDLERERKKMYHQCLAKVNEIRFVISMIDKPIPRLVLELHYVEFMGWDEIAFKLHYSVRHITNFHGYGLDNLVKINKKIVENGGKPLF